MIVSLAFLYNFWVIIFRQNSFDFTHKNNSVFGYHFFLFRFSFAEITWETFVIWFSLDYSMDVIYLLDIVFHFRTGYLEVSKKGF